MKRQAEPTEKAAKRRKIDETDLEDNKTAISRCQTQMEVEKFKVPQLKTFLTAHGLEITGTKPALVARIMRHLVPPQSTAPDLMKSFLSAANEIQQGTLFEKILPDLFAAIHFYWIHKRRFEERPALKPAYVPKTRLGSKGPEKGKFQSPEGIAIDYCGRFFIADTKNNRIQIFGADWAFLDTFGKGGIGAQADFSHPHSLAFDLEGNLLVLDPYSRVQVLDHSGKVKLTFGGTAGIVGSDDGKLWAPGGITIDNDGNYVVCDTLNNRIQIFDTKGVWKRKFGTKGKGFGELNVPVGIAVDFEGYEIVLKCASPHFFLFRDVSPTVIEANRMTKMPTLPPTCNFVVSDTGNHRIVIFDPAGQAVRMIGGRGNEDGKFWNPWGLSLDGLGNIILADTQNSRVQMVSKTGEFLMNIGSYGIKGGCVYNPKMAIVDRRGNLVVLDTKNNRIQIFGEELKA